MKQSILLFLVLLTFSGCYNDKAEVLYPCDLKATDVSTYSGVVNGILTNNCASAAGCHMNESTNLSGVLLDNVAGAQTVARNGKLLGAINHQTGFFPMPKGATKLKECDILKITKWVEGGALNN